MGRVAGALPPNEGVRSAIGRIFAQNKGAGAGGGGAINLDEFRRRVKEAGEKAAANSAGQ